MPNNDRHHLPFMYLDKIQPADFFSEFAVLEFLIVKR